MNKRKPFTLERAADKLAEFLENQSLSESVTDYLKVVEAFARTEKAKIEVQLLKEDLRERRRQRANSGRKSVRQAGISPEAQAEIDALLGLRGSLKREA